METTTTDELVPSEETIVASDGRGLGARVFHGSGPGVVVIAGATGVLQRFYAELARTIAARGPTVVTFDYRGIGASRAHHPRREPARMRDWGHLDIEAALQYAADLAERVGGDVRWIGQSAGACFLPLARSRNVATRIVTVSALSGYWRLMVPVERVKLGLGWYTAFPAVVGLTGYAPRRFWGGEDLPPGVAREFGRWCRNPDYFFGDETLNTSGFADMTAPILAMRATDDPWATPVAHRALHDAFTSAEVEYLDVSPQDVGAPRIGHIDLLRGSIGRPVWPRMLDWLLDPDPTDAV